MAAVKRTRRTTKKLFRMGKGVASSLGTIVGNQGRGSSAFSFVWTAGIDSARNLNGKDFGDAGVSLGGEGPISSSIDQESSKITGDHRGSLAHLEERGGRKPRILNASG